MQRIKSVSAGVPRRRPGVGAPRFVAQTRICRAGDSSRRLGSAQCAEFMRDAQNQMTLASEARPIYESAATGQACFLRVLALFAHTPHSRRENQNRPRPIAAPRRPTGGATAPATRTSGFAFLGNGLEAAPFATPARRPTGGVRTPPDGGAFYSSPAQPIFSSKAIST